MISKVTFGTHNSNDFMTNSDATKIRHYFSTRHGINLVNDFSQVDVQIKWNNESFFGKTEIPIKTTSNTVNLVQVTPIPFFKKEENKTKIPSMSYDDGLYAINVVEQTFTPLTPSEFEACQDKTQRCISSSPTFSLKHAPCEIATFFRTASSECRDEDYDGKLPFFKIGKFLF